MRRLTIAILLVIVSVMSAPVRVLVIRGYMSYDRNTASQSSFIKCVNALSETDGGIDIILFPEFAFGGRDGTAWGHPAVYFEWENDSVGFRTYPYDSTNIYDRNAATYIDSLRYIAISETCYIWASSCGEIIDGINYNTIPIFQPDGKLYRLRRKCLYSTPVVARDTTIHPDTVALKSGDTIAVMTTICYENSALAPLLDPIDPPSPLWLLPHGTWTAAGVPWMTYVTQKWVWDPNPITLSGVWSIPLDGWVTYDAVLISADIYGTEWTAMGIDNYGDDRDPIAYEPLAYIDERPNWVLIDCNIPGISDTLPVVRAKPSPEPAFDRLTALPRISNFGPVFIHGTTGTIEIYGPEGDLITTLRSDGDFVVWEAGENGANPQGEYTIRSGGETTTITILE